MWVQFQPKVSLSFQAMGRNEGLSSVVEKLRLCYEVISDKGSVYLHRFASLDGLSDLSDLPLSPSFKTTDEERPTVPPECQSSHSDTQEPYMQSFILYNIVGHLQGAVVLTVYCNGRVLTSVQNVS